MHDRQVGGLFTLENATRIKSNLSVLLDQTGPVTDKPTRHDELTIRVHGRNRMACRECSELLHPGVEKNIRTDEQRLSSCLDQAREGGIEFAVGACSRYLNLYPDDRSRRQHVSCR